MRNQLRTMRLMGAAAVAFFSLPLMAQHGSTTVVNPYTSREDEQAGAKLFRSQCAGCHGPDGTGMGAGPSLVGAFAHGDSDEAVFRTISKGLPGTSMPAFSFSGLQIWELVTHIHALGIAHGASQLKGDPMSGAAIFRANCSRCHSAAAEAGGLSGPDLTAIGARRSYAELRDSLRDPDAEVASQYWSVVATTSTGGTVRGLRLNEDTFSLQIRDENGRLLSLLKRNLKDVELIRRSPMPSFAGKLSDAQMDDVIAWLISLGRRQ